MALEQHAIPTEVTTYEFRLVGDMTLKQFGWLAGGIMIGVLSYVADFIPFFIRWPVVVIFPITGAAIAFVPFQGRTLDRWIIAFIKAIYAPTEFIWHKELIIPAYLQANRPVTLSTPSTQKQINVSSNQIQEYLQSLTYQRNSTAPDQLEASRLANINNLLDPNSPPQTQILSQTISTTTPQFSPVPLASSDYFPQIQDPKLVSQMFIEDETIEEPQPETMAIETVEAEETDTQPNPTQNSSAPEQSVETPTTQTAQETSSVSQEPEFDSTIQSAMSASIETPNLTVNSSPNGSQTFTSRHLPPTPTMNNVIAGVVVDTQDTPIPNAIVEINTAQNQPVRALKTNQLGQFAIVTPLSEGQYLISADKDNYIITPLSIEVTNNIVPPITIICQSGSLPS